MIKAKRRGSGLIQSWLDYCEFSLGESRADVIRRVNQLTGTKNTNQRFYDFIIGARQVPPSVIGVINSDLEGLLNYLIGDLKQNPSDLAKSLKLPVKNNKK